MAEEYVNASQSSVDTAAKYLDPTRIASSGPLANIVSDAGAGRATSAFSAIDPRRLDLKIPFGAEAAVKPKPVVQTFNINGKKQGDDNRVKIRIPEWYFTDLTVGYNSQLKNLRGIIFPYTPSISFEVKADYSSQNPLHSNFNIHFYQKSSVGSISISGKFTVENKKDAENYLATTHLLKALTRMKFGPDADAGAPPPVCRLDAYGEMMLHNVPVAIVSFRVELPDDIDYFTLESSEVYGKNSVPTRSTIQINCIPMYSRDEMQQFSVNSYLNNRDMRGFI
jgi:hypothetical protein